MEELLPVPAAALRELCAAVRASVSATIRPDPLDLVDLDLACLQARRFKLDASFALDRAGTPRARFSVNDKGEPAAFRERLWRPVLGLPGELRRLLDAVPPGEVQTTLGLKWGAAGGPPERTTLYFEELHTCPRAAAVVGATFLWGLGMAAPPAPAGLPPAAVALDFAGGRVVGARDYHLAVERDDRPAFEAVGAAAAFRAVFPLDPRRGTRRWLVARRFDRRGAPGGSKLLWVSEARSQADADRAWVLVDRQRAAGAWPASTTSSALDDLRRNWSFGDRARLYPDLVSLDLAADMTPQALLVYVSVK